MRLVGGPGSYEEAMLGMQGYGVDADGRSLGPVLRAPEMSWWPRHLGGYPPTLFNLTGGPLKRKMIFQDPSFGGSLKRKMVFQDPPVRFYVDWWEGIHFGAVFLFSKRDRTQPFWGTPGFCGF